MQLATVNSIKGNQFDQCEQCGLHHLQQENTPSV